MQPYFKSYSAYCANYPYVGGTLAAACSEPRVATFLHGAEAQHGVTLPALLFRPVQRMCQYPLLFQQALKHAPQGHPQHEVIEGAFMVTQQAVSTVNEKVREQEKQLRMLKVLTTEVAGAPPVEQLLVPHRSLVREAYVDMKASGSDAVGDDALQHGIKSVNALLSGWGVRRRYKWYVFSDVLMICQPPLFSATAERTTYKALFDLADLHIWASSGSAAAASKGLAVRAANISGRSRGLSDSDVFGREGSEAERLPARRGSNMFSRVVGVASSVSKAAVAMRSGDRSTGGSTSSLDDVMDSPLATPHPAALGGRADPRA